jgi:hypothetical protein
MPCGDFACNASATACLMMCTADAQCATTARPYCEDGACVASHSNGAACRSAQECASNRCVDGYCCNDACTASCQACDVAGHLGSCWPVTGTTPRGGRPGCGGTRECAGYCGGLESGQCVFPSGTPCECGLLDGTCNGAGQCQLLADVCI